MADSVATVLNLLDAPMLLVDERGLVVFANESAQSRLGVSCMEQRWSDIQDKLPADYIYRFHEVPDTLLDIHKPSVTGRAQTEYPGWEPGHPQPERPQSGRWMLVECTARSDTSMAEELRRLQQTNEELERILNTLFDEVFVTDGSGITVRVDRMVDVNYGLTADELVGKSVFDLERDKVFYPSVTAMVLRERKRITALQTTRLGRRLIVTGNPVFDANGDIVRVISYTRDITSPTDSEWTAPSASEETPGPAFVAADLAMQRVLALCRRVAPTQATVLLLGETGVGKNRVAHLIHTLSGRKDGPYVEINCATIPESLFESELFGYERGAFTGARREGKPGKAELADGGTLFLNEIAEVPLHIQAKLLDLVQEHVITRVGGERPRRVNLRIIAATNQDLETLVQEGRFRRDLYYRLNVVPVTLPPLRERPTDIPHLVHSLLDYFCRRNQIPTKVMHPDALDCLKRYAFPGNIRELENLLERLVITVEDPVLLPEHLPPNVLATAAPNRPQTAKPVPTPLVGAPYGGLRAQLEAVERALIADAAGRCRTTYEMAAQLGISQSTVVRKLKQYGIHPPDGAAE
ncbi:sigma 54-interacting transcriptional regulator [Alicyclobacillus contaminans]|uniref:sigma 54-interacting transcriptional regulator n=1 Tax=Alicyclobacillus contaminans TaxID=392016 RepID=UPI001FE1A841|nr:sigma 54-interacting transcriptional regulator [Alicyclobacillus contaminans]